MAEPVVITVAIAGLAGVKFPRFFMFAAQIGYTLGFIFAYWLLYTSYFVIGALCPWCLLVTLTTTLVWFAITRYNIRENNLFLPKKTQKALEKFIAKDYDKLVMAIVITVIVAALVLRYGDGLLY
jgi:lauroyl/myristoyl acyltransferase